MIRIVRAKEFQRAVKCTQQYFVSVKNCAMLQNSTSHYFQNKLDWFVVMDEIVEKCLNNRQSKTAPVV